MRKGDRYVPVPFPPVCSSRLEIFSHDVRARDGAILHGLKALKLPESWLLRPEPSPHERKMAEMREEIRLLSETQPRFEISIRAVEEQPLSRVLVGEPTDAQTAGVRKVLMKDAGRPPTIEHGIWRDPFGDTSHPTRWADWAKRLAERDLPLMHRGLSRLFSQHILEVRIENVGAVAAAQLSIEIASGNATLHDRPFYVQVFGPPAPQPRAGFYDPLRNMPTIHDLMNRDPFVFSTDEGGPGPLLRFVCADFRQGRSHVFQIALEVEERTGEKAQTEVRVTCSNMKGAASTQILIPIEHRHVAFADLVNEGKPLLKATPPVFEALQEAEGMGIYRNNSSRYEK